MTGARRLVVLGMHAQAARARAAHLRSALVSAGWPHDIITRLTAEMTRAERDVDAYTRGSACTRGSADADLDELARELRRALDRLDRVIEATTRAVCADAREEVRQ